MLYLFARQISLSVATISIVWFLLLPIASNTSSISLFNALENLVISDHVTLRQINFIASKSNVDEAGNTYSIWSYHLRVVWRSVAKMNTKRNSKEKLIKVMAVLLLEKGLANTSPNDILTRAEVGQGSLYHYFQGKEDLSLAAIKYVTIP